MCITYSQEVLSLFFQLKNYTAFLCVSFNESCRLTSPQRVFVAVNDLHCEQTYAVLCRCFMLFDGVSHRILCIDAVLILHSYWPYSGCYRQVKNGCVLLSYVCGLSMLFIVWFFAQVCALLQVFASVFSCFGAIDGKALFGLLRILCSVQ